MGQTHAFLYRIKESDREGQWGRITGPPQPFSLGDSFSERAGAETEDLEIDSLKGFRDLGAPAMSSSRSVWALV